MHVTDQRPEHFYCDFFNMSMLSKLRLVTVDVTGTLLAYKGELGDYYCMAAKSIGLPCPDYKRVHEGFKQAYTEMAKKHPCFGFSEKIPNIIWWKTCVRDSFVRVREFEPSCNISLQPELSCTCMGGKSFKLQFFMTRFFLCCSFYRQDMIMMKKHLRRFSDAYMPPLVPQHRILSFQIHSHS